MTPPWIAPLFAAAAVIVATPNDQLGRRGAEGLGLDHIPIAVGDLENAADRYRALGFALKPGRPHDNGIRNQHAKFPDGTELELITAPAAHDELTSTYRTHLASGDGPAFLAFHAPGLNAAARTPAPSYIFFGGLNHSPTDKPEHFAHPNGAHALIAVWLAADDLSRERALLSAMGATIVTREVRVPEPMRTDVARLAGDEVILLPGRFQFVAGRRIIGATVAVTSVRAARSVVERAAGTPLQRTAGSLFLPPASTHGLWLELREAR